MYPGVDMKEVHENIRSLTADGIDPADVSAVLVHIHLVLFSFQITSSAVSVVLDDPPTLQGIQIETVWDALGLGGGGQELSRRDSDIARELSCQFTVEASDTDHQLVMILAAMEGNGVQCPACGLIIEKVGGDDTMMCGCEGRPAGGTMEKALAGRGCGHEFNFSTGMPIGQGSPGSPANERQWKFRTPASPPALQAEVQCSDSRELSLPSHDTHINEAFPPPPSAPPAAYEDDDGWMHLEPHPEIAQLEIGTSEHLRGLGSMEEGANVDRNGGAQASVEARLAYQCS